MRSMAGPESTAWLAQVSGDPPAQPPPVPPGAWAYPAPGRLAAAARPRDETAGMTDERAEAGV